MAISGFLFLSWRIFEIIITTPIVGMLGWFVHQYVRVNQLTPDYILVLFIVSTLALAWTFFTVISYLRARHDALFVAFVDLLFFGAFIAGVVLMRNIAKIDCSNLNAGVTTSGSYFDLNVNKTCAMLKACFALGIICVIAFFVTFPSLSTITTRTTTKWSSNANTTTRDTATDVQEAETTAAAATTTARVALAEAITLAVGGITTYEARDWI
ncbi:hypothetical protein LTR37_009467 [Vermiconidia calcicola]|uniref:Uncharacterized protein n=1 Tax=Vermiconidia calcicola TaxID=1690605 RepID=A0ACC3N7K8_9PEZI|nr:hypothetical protein LTR37_009467 [Vermiconidia calcicola]